MILSALFATDLLASSSYLVSPVFLHLHEERSFTLCPIQMQTLVCSWSCESFLEAGGSSRQQLFLPAVSSLLVSLTTIANSLAILLGECPWSLLLLLTLLLLVPLQDSFPACLVSCPAEGHVLAPYWLPPAKFLACTVKNYSQCSWN